jgi:UDP-glucose:(glucosyl)LPS beta-1,3-glucosyltransferase
LDTFYISFIIPVYNREATIERAILSITNQPYKQIEIVVVDDGSNDRTSQVVKELQAKDNRIVYCRQANKGVSSARNLGMSIAKGDFIGFLDSDDEFLGEAYSESMFEKFDSRIEVYVRSYINYQKSKKDNLLQKWLIKYILKGGDLQIQSLLIKRFYLESNKLIFKESLFIGEDKLFIIECLLKCNYFEYESVQVGKINHDTFNSITGNYKSLKNKRNFFLSRVFILGIIIKSGRIEYFGDSFKQIFNALKILIFHFILKLRVKYFRIKII